MSTQETVCIDQIVSELPFEHSQYYEHERSILQPKLEEQGYQLIGNWYSVERDSFGPLIRGVRALKDGKPVLLIYG